jgi:hypothetical protein
MTNEKLEVLKQILAELEAIRKENQNSKEICDAVKYYGGI